MQKLEVALPGGLIFLQHFGPGDVRRHQVGSELHATEAQADGIRQRANHERLGQSRHTHQQTVPASKDGDQQLFENTFLADDGLAQLLADTAIAIVEPLDCR